MKNGTVPMFAPLRRIGFSMICATLAASLSAADVEWERKAISLPESTWSVEAIDLNADERPDLVVMGEKKVFALLAPEWKPQVLFDTIEPKMLYCVALDADGDGDLDLALGRYRVPAIEYRQALAEGKTASEPKGPDFSVGWLENSGRSGEAPRLHVLDRELNGIHGLCVGDVNGDGRVDLFADSINGPGFPNSLACFVSKGRGAGFEREIITRDGADGRPHYMEFADVDGDGKGELLLGDSKGGTFTFWKRVSPGKWSKNLIGREPGATNIRAADVNGDGKMDVVGSCGHGKGVFWFEGPGWTKHAIDAEFASPHALATGDFDKDGDMDVGASSVSAVTVRWYENKGGGQFTMQTIDAGNEQQSYDLKATDLDKDGRLDLILAGRESKNGVWYRNVK